MKIRPLRCCRPYGRVFLIAGAKYARRARDLIYAVSASGPSWRNLPVELIKMPHSRCIVAVPVGYGLYRYYRYLRSIKAGSADLDPPGAGG